MRIEIKDAHRVVSATGVGDHVTIVCEGQFYQRFDSKTAIAAMIRYVNTGRLPNESGTLLGIQPVSARAE